MSTFIGRRQELKALENAYQQTGTGFIPIYGRRRVGKSELILRFIENKPSLYFLGKKAVATMQIREFLHSASRALEEPLLDAVAATDWQSVLELVLQRKRKRGKIVLVFDEFQWTAQASPELPSILQGLLDGAWKKRGDILLILCGSYLGFMEKNVLGEKSPLFGRRTGQILLKPFAYIEAAQFHPSWSPHDQAKAYFICGGIPYYLRFFASRDSIDQNIRQNLLNEYAALHREPDFLLREELRELENYFGILIALSSGSLTIPQISRTTRIPEKNMYYYLQQLVELGYVSRRFPLTGERPNRRHVRFALDDPLLRFWFRFVYPNTGFLSQMGARNTFQELIRPHLESYYGSCFERLCREALPYLYRKEGVDARFEVGEYWDKDVQIDLVGYREDDRVDIGECKWGAVRSLPAIAKDLKEKIRRYPNPRNATIQERLFLRRRPRTAADPKTAKTHTLDELYGL